MIVIIDYKMGNLRSVQKACEFVGLEAIITSDPKIIKNSDRLILPGVGAFCDAINMLNSGGLSEVIKDEVKKGKYFLGICLGHQLLFDKSYENGEYQGLGLIKGEVVKFNNPEYKIPHIGWNHLSIQQDPFFRGFSNNCPVYFVHSYYAVTDQDNIIATSNYCGIDFTAAVRRDNIIGTQFHPEKSGGEGIKLLKNFGALK